jgi:choice-of-anchor C domain-containing protein
MKILGLFAGAAMLVLAAQGASAATISNGSFETGSVNPGSFQFLGAGSTAIDGWTVGGAGGIDYIGTYWTASNGGRSVDLSGGGIGSISTLISGLTVGQEYTISYDLAGNPAGAPTTKHLQVAVDSVGGTIGGHLATFNTGAIPSTLSNMGWITQTVIFTATAATATLTFLSQDNTSYGPALDNVTIAATPIPGAILLFGSALGGMGFLGYRRKKLQAAA